MFKRVLEEIRHAAKEIRRVGKHSRQVGNKNGRAAKQIRQVLKRIRRVEKHSRQVGNKIRQVGKHSLHDPKAVLLWYYKLRKYRGNERNQHIYLLQLQLLCLYRVQVLY